MEPFSIEETEENGVFCRILFDDLDHPLLLFIVDQDYEVLLDMAEKEDVGWEEFRNELFTLVEHSGHDQEHTLTEQTVAEIRECLSDLAEKREE